MVPLSHPARAPGIALDVQHSLSLTSPSGQVKPVFHKHGCPMTKKKKKKKAVSALVMRQLMTCRLCRTPARLHPQHWKLAEFNVKTTKTLQDNAWKFCPCDTSGDEDRAPLGCFDGAETVFTCCSGTFFQATPLRLSLEHSLHMWLHPCGSNLPLNT